MVLCREGHVSDEPDYCSVCGAPIAIAGVGRGISAGARATSCPACGEPREAPDARFCEVCRYDFIGHKPGPPPVARAAPPREWELIISVDPALDTDPDPDSPCPEGEPERVITVRKPELLVGRHDDTRDIHPEISLQDPGASRRHAKFVRDPDGGMALQDLASTNGTDVNGETVPPGTRRRLSEGDRVTLGRWTAITLRGRR